MTQTIDIVQPDVVAITSLSRVPDAKREKFLTGIALASINRGDGLKKTVGICQVLNTTRFEAPYPAADVESAVMKVAEAAKLVSERAETDPEATVATLNKKFVWLSGPKAIFDLQSRCVVKKEALKAHYANTCAMLMNNNKQKRTTHFDAWMQSKDRREHVDVTFVPGGAPIVNDRVNLWKRWAIAPVAGDVSPWNALMDHLFGAASPERTWAEQWFAYPIQHPGKKMHTAMLIWSATQGIGKTLVAESVGKLYGRHFTTINGKLLRSKYNGWAHDALLVFGEEKDSDQRSEANMLKHLVTGPTVSIEEKYRAAFECTNRMNFVFTSNHADAFLLDKGDRRYFVWNAAVSPKEPAFYDAYGAWIESSKGLAALMHHMLHLDMTGFDPHGHAPITKAKLAMIELSKSDLDQWLGDAMTDDYIDNHIRREIVTLAELVRLYQHDTGALRTTPKAMSMALRKHVEYAQDRISVRGKRVQVVTLRNHARWDVQDRTDWSIEYQKPSAVVL